MVRDWIAKCVFAFGWPPQTFTDLPVEDLEWYAELAEARL